MKQTILIGTNRSTGKDEIIAGSEVPYNKQLEVYKFMGKSSINDSFSGIGLFHLQPVKRVVKFVQKAEKHSPTFEEYTAAGYAPEGYPPAGYSEVDSPGLRAYRQKAASESQPEVPPVTTAEDKNAVVETVATPAPAAQPPPRPAPSRSHSHGHRK